MLKFIKHHMTSIEGVSIFPIISLIIFGLFFTVLLIWTLKSSKKRMKKISEYPLVD